MRRYQCNLYRGCHRNQPHLPVEKERREHSRCYPVSYTINNINATHAGTYTVLVHGDCGADVISNPAVLTVNPATAITTQPQPVTQCAGTNATFTVVADGTNLTYQWRKDGPNIPGATGSSYTINNINAGNAGNYSVIVHSDCGADVTSNAAALTVNPVTAITTQPVALTQCAGTNATFTVVANGTAITYQWRKDGTDIPGCHQQHVYHQQHQCR